MPHGCYPRPVFTSPWFPERPGPRPGPGTAGYPFLGWSSPKKGGNGSRLGDLFLVVTKLLLNRQSWGRVGPGPQGDKFKKRLILTKIHVFLRLAKEARQVWPHGHRLTPPSCPIPCGRCLLPPFTEATDYRSPNSPAEAQGPRLLQADTCASVCCPPAPCLSEAVAPTEVDTGLS